MNKKSRIASTLRTRIADLPVLSTEELKLAAGGMGNFRVSLGGLGAIDTIGTCGDGKTKKTTYPASVTNPGETDTATDTEED